MEEMVKVTAMKLTNKVLKGYTTKLKNCGENIRKNYIKIAHLLVEIESTECYLDDGFSDVQEYASKVLNIQKTTCYNLLKIGREYLDGSGEKTLLATADGDYSVSQIQALLPLGFETAKEWSDTDYINPSMSVRKLKDLVNEAKSDVEDAEDEDVVDADATETYEEDLEELATITFFKSGDLHIKGDGLKDYFIESVKAIYDTYLSE